MAQISHVPILQAVIAGHYANFTDLWMSNRLRPKPHKANYLRREGGRQSVTLFILCRLLSGFVVDHPPLMFE
jgi:hypothetical protein